MPFAPVQERFQSISPSSGRLELRQGDDRGDLRLLANGSPAAEREASGLAIPETTLSVVAALPRAYIVLPKVWPLTALFGLLCLGGGLYLLWMRNRLGISRTVEVDEPVFADLIENPPEPAPSAPMTCAAWSANR